jgi:hypothetical protein
VTTSLRSLTVAASLLIVLSAEARQTDDGVRLDRLWRDAGRITDLDGRVLTRPALAARVEAPVWVVRMQAAWCGTCQWHAAWTPALSARYGARVAVIDVLVADEDNAPADARSGARWRERAGEAAVILLADPSALAGAFHAPAPLPRVLVVDGRTSAVVATLANPDPDRLTAAIDRALPDAAVASSKLPLVDGRFTPDQWALIEGMRLPDAPPPDPTNRVADDPRAADLGFLLFFEKALSPLGIACSNCHNQDRLFAENQDRPSYGATPWSTARLAHRPATATP